VNTNFDDIADFHHRFALAHLDGPRQLPHELQLFRIAFMQEELNEYMRATLAEDLEKQVDALVDLVYVALGTAYLQGFEWQDHWNEVHRANMKKERAQSKSQSVRSSTFDVVKPAGWTAPDHLKVFKTYWSQAA
jgi:predicted HAD superfamily Cof-like phosphohydrolase